MREYPKRGEIWQHSQGWTVTALTVSQLTAGCVVAAISAGNLPNVAQALRARWPEVKIVIAGDNDFQDAGENPGKAFAEKAAKAVSGWVSLPPGEIKADWNDFHREHGVTRAREAFRNGLVLCGEGRTQLPHGFRLTTFYVNSTGVYSGINDAESEFRRFLDASIIAPAKSARPEVGDDEVLKETGVYPDPEAQEVARLRPSPMDAHNHYVRKQEEAQKAAQQKGRN